MRLVNIVSPEDQRVTFIELFFDLVFVFGVTQVVSLLHHDLDWVAVGQAVLVFWLVWWAWTQFTWALNAADTTHHLVELGTLAATAVAFFMAVALPDAFHGQALAFAVPYVLVRAIGLILYYLVAAEDPSQRAAVQRFALVSLSGLVTVIVGALAGGTLQYVFWGITILLDVIAATIGGRSEGWNLHPEHFAERHGLFVIIALGETLIVAAGGVTGTAWTGDLITIAILAVAVTCGLWWTYFTRTKPVLDHALETSHGSGQSMMARDVFSLIHFPMLCGIIAYALVVEEAIAHPGEPLPAAVQITLALGLLSFTGGKALALWRATGRVLLPRLIVTIAAALAIIALTGTPSSLALAIALVGVVVVAVIEHRASHLSIPAHVAAAQHKTTS